jgi:hypothetical protein
LNDVALQLVAFYKECGYDVSEKIEQARPKLMRRKEDLEIAEARKEHLRNLRVRWPGDAQELIDRVVAYAEVEANRNETEVSGWSADPNDVHLQQESLAQKRSKREA